MADESCDFRVVRALRAAGHDVMSVLEIAPGASDETVIAWAMREDRIFITEDHDFGQLTYAASRPTPGVILVRFPSAMRAELPALMTELVSEHGARLRDRFTVIQPGRVRFGSILRD